MDCGSEPHRLLVRYAPLVLAVLCAVPVIVAEPPKVGPVPPRERPVPEWIWLRKTAAANELVILRTVFKVRPNLISAQLVAACDDRVSVFVNGEQVVEHGVWQKPLLENLTARLKPGKNVIACRCNSRETGTAGLLVQLSLEYADGLIERVLSNPSWKGAKDPAENWRTVDYDDSTWAAAISHGKLGCAPWGELRLPSAASVAATPPEDFQLPEGFRVERLYSVPKADQGSWVSLTCDPRGRLIVSDQYGGLYRVTIHDQQPVSVEKLNVPIGEAQGLTFVGDSLYVSVNGSAAQGSGLYRLRDTNGDDQFDEVRLLKKMLGGGEHGPHSITLGPDGLLYLVAGNHTRIPDGSDPRSPHRNYQEDLLLPRNPDGRGHSTGVLAPGGWIARTDLEGQRWEILCGGFRNPFDVAFSPQGELFTFDADMEWDTGTPWYRPIRVNHAVSAGEYGWRYGTGKWPAYYADSLGAVADVGFGSPTGIAFGTGARFPPRYQRALFVSDWTYGKIYAVHLQPAGASYIASFETFAQAKPLPVTDLVVHPTGGMYFIIGGRRTQSGLYRITYSGTESTAPVFPVDDPASNKARRLRKQLEVFHTQPDPAAIDLAWPLLDSADRALRYAARVAVERQDVALWRQRALDEPRPTARIQALLALTRSADAAAQEAVLARLNSLPFAQLTEEQLLDALRVYQLAFIRLGEKTSATAASVSSCVDALYPHPDPLVNRELSQLLVYLEAPGVIERSMKLLAEAQTQEDQVHYAFVLRNLATGWTLEQRRAYFGWMNLAESKYRGGASFQRFVQQIRDDAVGKLSAAEQAALKDVLEGGHVETVNLETTRQFVHNWQLDDVAPLLGETKQGRSFESGARAYEAAQCAKCHRFAGRGGDTGPDITGVGSRFDALYILESLIDPSKAISDQYVTSIIETDAGKVISGRVIVDLPTSLKIRTSPFARELTEIPKSSIESRQPSPVSEMPKGLINVLTQEEILDLIAYLRSAGNRDDKAFKKP